MSKPTTAYSVDAKPVGVASAPSEPATPAAVAAKVATTSAGSTAYSGRTRVLYNAHVGYNERIFYNGADPTLNQFRADTPTIATKSSKPVTAAA